MAVPAGGRPVRTELWRYRTRARLPVAIVVLWALAAGLVPSPMRAQEAQGPTVTPPPLVGGSEITISGDVNGTLQVRCGGPGTRERFVGMIGGRQYQLDVESIPAGEVVDYGDPTPMQAVQDRIVLADFTDPSAVMGWGGDAGEGGTGVLYLAPDGLSGSLDVHLTSQGDGPGAGVRVSGSWACAAATVSPSAAISLACDPLVVVPGQQQVCLPSGTATVTVSGGPDVTVGLDSLWAPLSAMTIPDGTFGLWMRDDPGNRLTVIGPTIVGEHTDDVSVNVAPGPCVNSSSWTLPSKPGRSIAPPRPPVAMKASIDGSPVTSAQAKPWRSRSESTKLAGALTALAPT